MQRMCGVCVCVVYQKWEVSGLQHLLVPTAPPTMTRSEMTGKSVTENRISLV